LQMKIYMCIWLRPRSLQLEMTHALQYTAYLLTRQDDAGTGPSICRHCDETKVDKVFQAHPLQLLKYIKYHYVSLSYSE
jgi:hypothetical protein